MRDAWRLALGTFTVIRVTPPDRLDRGVAAHAMVLAPATTVPALVACSPLAWASASGWLSPAAAAALALVATALLSRAMHLDGLADTADGLSASFDRARSLEVMRRGDTGPSGVAAVVLVLLADAASLSALLATPRGAVLAATALVASRLAPALVCRRGLPAARPDGLGATVADSVSRTALAGSVLAVTAFGALALRLVGLSPYAAALVVAAAALGAWLVARRASRRLGGITGDVIGASVEVALVAALVTASVAGTVLVSH